MQTLITTAARRTISSHIQQEENLGWANRRNPVARRQINILEWVNRNIFGEINFQPEELEATIAEPLAAGDA